MFLYLILTILLFVYVVASVKGTIAATSCKHTMFGNVDLMLGGRCTGVVCSPDNYAYVDIAILLFFTAVIIIFLLLLL